MHNPPYLNVIAYASPRRASVDETWDDDPAPPETSSEPQGADWGEMEVVAGFPAYNEEIGIGSVVLEAHRYADEVVVVDDGSTDRTAPIAEAAGATVLRHETNQGKGSAVQTFLEHANDTDCGTAVVLDADGQHVPSDITRVVEPIASADADVVIGSRYLRSTDDETPRYRRLGQRLLDYLTLATVDETLTDTQSGFRAFSARAIDRIDLRTNGIGVESEIIREASEKGLDIEEVPIEVRYEDIDGQTYNPLRHGLVVMKSILR